MPHSQKRHGPDAQQRTEAANHACRSADSTTDPVALLLGRLERVRKSGRGWTAKCPAHEDRTASLSIAQGEGGACLVHCFAGCSAADVALAAGLTLADLFPKRPTASMSFAERAALREHGRQAQWRAALNVLGFEAKIVQIFGRDLMAKRVPTDEDCERLILACNRIDDAREVLNARSH